MKRRAKLWSMIGLLFASFTMVIAGIGRLSGLTAIEANATTVTWPGTSALPGTYTNINNDPNVQIKVNSTNTYSNPIRVYANTTIFIKTASGYHLTSVTYEASSTGNYVTYAQNAEVTPLVTPTVSGRNVTWSLSDATEFTFKPSTQTRSNGITVAYESSSSTVAVTGVALNKSSTTINVGSTETLTATISPADATNKNVTWTSSDPSVASVSSSGVITGVASGSATITVTTANGGFHATCAVTVNAVPLTGIALSDSSISIVSGATKTLTVTFTPSDATNKTIIWSTSDSDVATVSDGVVTGEARGTATITAMSDYDHDLIATCEVTVANRVTYTIASASSVTSSGKPTGSEATFVNTYTNNKNQMTAGKTMTLTVTPGSGNPVLFTSIKLRMHSNQSSGAGKIYYQLGSDAAVYLVGSAGSGVGFSDSSFHGGWSTDYVDVSLDLDSGIVVTNSKPLTFIIAATANSLYCEAFAFDYDLYSPLDSIAIADPRTAFEEADTWQLGDDAVITATMENESTKALSSSQLSFYIANDAVGTSKTALSTSTSLSVAGHNNKYVYATYEEGGVTKACAYQITVTYKTATSVSLEPGPTITVEQASETTFTATKTGEHTNPNYVWNVSSEDIPSEDCVVEEDGAEMTLTVLTEEEGTITVTVSVVGTETRSATTTVNVTAEKSVELDQHSLTKYYGNGSATSFDLTATLMNYGGTAEINWATSNASVLSLGESSNNGKTKTINIAGAGSADITVTVTEDLEVKSDVCSVTVNANGVVLEWLNRGPDIMCFAGDELGDVVDTCAWVFRAVYDDPNLSPSVLSRGDVTIRLCDDDSGTNPGDAITDSHAFTKQEDGLYITAFYQPASTVFVSAYNHAIRVCEKLNSISKPVEENERFTLVTDLSDIHDGDTVAITSAVGSEYDYTFSEHKENNFGAQSISRNGYHFTCAGEPILFVVTVDANGYFSFKCDAGYLYASSSSANQLKARAAIEDGNAKFSSSISDGVVTLTATGDNTRNTMRFNPNNDSPLFSCYASTSAVGSLTSIYKYVDKIECSNENVMPQYAVIEFAETFTALMDKANVCGTGEDAGYGVNYGSNDFSNAWDDAAAAYETILTHANTGVDAGTFGKYKLTSDELAFAKSMLQYGYATWENDTRGGTPGVERDCLQRALKTYDHVVLHSELTPFLSAVRTPSLAGYIPGRYANPDSPLTTTLWIVLASGMAGLAAIGAAYFISKKKRERA